VLLRLMLQDLVGQDAIHRPTPFWEAASDDIAADLLADGFEHFRSMPSAQGFFVPTYGSPGNSFTAEDVLTIEDGFLNQNARGSKKFATLTHLLSGESGALADYRVLLAGDDPTRAPDLTAVSESKIGNPSEHFCFGERWFSRSFLNYLLGLVFLKQHADITGLGSVLEIGGGYGTLGEILHQIGGCSYVDVDIPPTAAVASYYLSNLGGNTLIAYDATRAVEPLSVPTPGQQMVLCPWQLRRLSGRIELFVNFISFQEMEPPVVQNYLREVDRLQARYVLLRNLKEGKQVKSDTVMLGVKTPVVGTDYDRFLAHYRLIAANVTPFGYRTIDGFHSELRLYQRTAEAVA
jgi:putative sugar O-methyltransferase